jgi:hypothetical protein
MEFFNREVEEVIRKKEVLKKLFDLAVRFLSGYVHWLYFLAADLTGIENIR